MPALKKLATKRQAEENPSKKKNKTKTVLQQTENKPKRHGEQNQEHG